MGSRDVDDHNIFWLYKVDKRTKDGNILTINGTYSLFDDLKAYGVIRDKRPNNVLAEVALQNILEDTRWEIGNNTSTHTGTSNYYYVSRLEAFWDFLEKWNIEFKPRMTFSRGKITGRYIDVADRLSDDYGKWYEYGDKLLTVTAEESHESLYTAFIGRGKGEETGEGYGRRLQFDDIVWNIGNGDPVDKPEGQDYVEIPWATELYGYPDGTPRMTVVVFEDIEDPNLLLEQTYQYGLEQCRPKAQFKASVLETELAELGEIVTIIRDDIGIRYKTRIFKLTRNFLNPNDKTFEFGDQIVQNTARRNASIEKSIKKQEEERVNWLDVIRRSIINDYFAEDGYDYDLKPGNEYELPAGRYSFDTLIDQSPTKVVYMGAGKILIANSKLPTGEWNWKTALNADGIVADVIATGILKGGKVHFDLTNGTLLIGNSTDDYNLLFDGSTLSLKNVNIESYVTVSSLETAGATTINGSNITTGSIRADLIQTGFNKIAEGVVITKDGLTATSDAGEYARIREGGVYFYTNDGTLNGSIESVYTYNNGEPTGETGVGIFIQPGHKFSVTRYNGDPASNQAIFEVPKDADELRLYRRINANGWNIDDVNQITSYKFKVADRGAYLLGNVQGGTSLIDSEKISLGIGTLNGWSNKIYVFTDRIEFFGHLQVNNWSIKNVNEIQTERILLDQERKWLIYQASSGSASHPALHSQVDGKIFTVTSEDYSIFVTLHAVNADPYVEVSRLYSRGNVSAASFTDRTPGYEGNALEDIKKIKNDENGNIDHSTLPEFAREKIMVPKNEITKEEKPTQQTSSSKGLSEEEAKKLDKVENKISTMALSRQQAIEDEQEEMVEEEGRDIGAMVSILTKGIQELIEVCNKQQEEINKLNNTILEEGL